MGRKERKAEEKRILAELDAAVAEEKAQTTQAGEVEQEQPPKKQEDTLHCRRCRTLMEHGVCPVCGCKTYIPMDEAKRKKVKGILTVVCLAVFIVLFAVIKS